MRRSAAVMFWFCTILLPGSVLAGTASQPAPADPMSAWRPLWTRQEGTGTAAVDDKTLHNDHPCVRIDHTGQQDWGIVRRQGLAVATGDILEISAWIKLEGEGRAAIDMAAYDAAGKVVDWMLGARWAAAPQGWQRLRSRAVVPAGVVRIEPRLVGSEPATVWVDGFACFRTATVQALRKADLPEEVTIENPALSVTLDTADATLRVLDKRTERTWSQKAFQPDVIVLDAAVDRNERMALRLHHVPSGMDIQAQVQFDPCMTEFTVTLSAEGELPGPLAWPHPFVTEEGTRLVVPLNEGIGYAVEDEGVEPMRLVGYGGHGICMAFWGVTDGEAGQMAIFETPDDAAINIVRSGGLLHVRCEWDAQKGRFGYRAPGTLHIP